MYGITVMVTEHAIIQSGSAPYLCSHAMHGQRIVTFDRARNFGQGQALLSFINALVGAWRGPSAGLVLIKAAPK